MVFSRIDDCQNNWEHAQETGRNYDGTVAVNRPLVNYSSELERLEWMLNHGGCDEDYNAMLREKIAFIQGVK